MTPDKITTHKNKLTVISKIPKTGHGGPDSHLKFDIDQHCSKWMQNVPLYNTTICC